MPAYQPGILSPQPPHARSLFFSLIPGTDPRAALRDLARLSDGNRLVIGIGPTLASALGHDIPGLHALTPITANGVAVPSTPRALWCWLRGTDRGELLKHARELENVLADAFRLDQSLDTFMHQHNRDLTGYEDGTENPEGDDALHAAFTADGSSFVAMQQWQQEWENFNHGANESRRHAEVEQSRIKHLETSIERLSDRIDRLGKEQGGLDAEPLDRGTPHFDPSTLAITTIDTGIPCFVDWYRSYTGC